MMHIVDYDGDQDAYFLMRLNDQSNQDESRYGACDDDCETTAPFIGILPNESEHEGGSPLHFHSDYEFESQQIDQEIAEAFKRGLP